MKLKPFIRRHENKLIVGGISFAVIGTAVLSSVAAYKIAKKAGGENPKKVWKESKKTFLKTYIVPYIPTVALTGATTAAVAITNNRYTKKIAAVESVATAATVALNSYKESIAENLKESDRVKVEQGSLKKQLTHAKNDPIVIADDETDVLMYEPLTGRYFRSTRQIVDTAVNRVNAEIINGWYWAKLNDFFLYIGAPELDTCEMGENVGWSTEYLLQVGYGSVVAPNGKPALVLEYASAPKPYQR